jgi:hypothetical protein
VDGTLRSQSSRRRFVGISIAEKENTRPCDALGVKSMTLRLTVRCLLFFAVFAGRAVAQDAGKSCDAVDSSCDAVEVVLDDVCVRGVEMTKRGVTVPLLTNLTRCTLPGVPNR